MKRIFLILIVTLLTHHAFAQVNSLDTLVFDISQAVTSGSYVEVPVSFLSDDSIVALDFSFKYNQVNFTCDSIIDLTTYLQELWYYNTNDSIMRFTSYSLQNIPNNTAVVMVRFNTLSGQLCGSDVNTVKGYLNGDVCSIKVVNCIPNGASDHENISLVDVYPNPARGSFFIQSKQKGLLSLFDMYGRKILSQIRVQPQIHTDVDTKAISDGVYFLMEENSSSRISHKIIIRN